VVRLFPRLEAGRLQQLIEDLSHAVGFARAGLVGVVTGKGARPHAENLDHLVRGVDSAMRWADLRVAMYRDPLHQRAKAQRLALELIQMACLRGHNKENPGALFEQMQRARRITIEGGATNSLNYHYVKAQDPPEYRVWTSDSLAIAMIGTSPLNELLLKPVEVCE
jgi:hypothetical protein